MSAKLPKAEVIEAIEELPEEKIALEDVIERLITLQRAKNGLQNKRRDASTEESTYDFTVGEEYTRKDVFRLIGMPEDTWGGPWFTGYARHGSNWFLFCNIGAAGRTGHDYANEWTGDQLRWYGKKRSKLSHPSIQSMIGEEGEVYIFYRSSNESSFTYAGRGEAAEVEDTTPVKVIWDFDS